MRLIFLAILCTLIFGFVSNNIQKKVIRSSEFDIHFYVSLKEKRANKNRMYHWFKSGEIHQSFGASGGLLLHDEFSRYYVGNQLAEKGRFDYGLKIGKWRQWYPNGVLRDELFWINGREHGSYSMFDTDGKLLISGTYVNGVKSSLWIDHAKEDTLWYKRGEEFKENPRLIKKREDSIAGKRSFLKRIFQKRDSLDNTKKRTRKDDLKETKSSFFKRLFQKKEKTKTKK